MCDLGHFRARLNTFQFLGGTESQTQSRGSKGILAYTHRHYTLAIHNYTIKYENIKVITNRRLS